MNESQFCWWLQGFMEIGKPYSLSAEQTQEIKNHLDLVFKKVTPVINSTYCNSKENDERFDFGYQNNFTAHTGISAQKLY